MFQMQEKKAKKAKNKFRNRKNIFIRAKRKWSSSISKYLSCHNI